MKLINVFVLVCLIGITFSCSDYNKVIKSDDYGRKMEVANSYYENGQVLKEKRKGKTKIKSNVLLRSVALYEQVYQRMPKTSEGELSYFRIGKAYYLAKDYTMAGYYLGVFPQRFPYSVKAEESMFLAAMCGVHNSPEVSLDQNETVLAINDLQQFIDRYPNSILVDSCNSILDKLHFKLELKDFQNVELYSKTERYAAAVSSAETFIADYPRSSFLEEVSFLMVQNSFSFAKNSVNSKKTERIEDTIERYSNFVAEFPESKHLSKLTSYMVQMENELSKIKGSEK
jgi:outer membrane protein assembly factor BamD